MQPTAPKHGKKCKAVTTTIGRAYTSSSTSGFLREKHWSLYTNSPMQVSSVLYTVYNIIKTVVVVYKYNN